MSNNEPFINILRHDTAHVLAMAVQELFPGTQVTIGPVIEDGFYYDFARKEPFTDEDLNKIENKMKEIIQRDEKTTREVWPRKKAIEHFKKIGETYKAEIIKTGTGLDVDYALTHSCYSPDNHGRHCGQCDACLLRRRGFEQAKVTDPTLYAI